MKPVCDWFAIVTALERAGMSQAQQAKEISVTQPSIYYWKTGKAEPGFASGLALIDLHKSVIGTTDGLID